MRASRKLLKKSTLALTLATVLAGAASAGTDIVTLQVPGIPGDAAFAAEYGLPADAIEVFSVSGGFTQTLNIGSQSSGAGAGKVTFNPIQVSKHFGASSPAVLLALATGTVYSPGTGGPVVINFYHVNHGSPHKYFSIQLSIAALASDQLSDSESRHSLDDLETLSFDYGVITLTDVTTGNTSCWNRVQNTRC